MLTLEMLKLIPAHTIFASGQFILETNPDGAVWKKWVAVRGGIHDWAIYAVEGPEELVYFWAWEHIKSNGDKISWKSKAREIVACDDEAYAMYRDR